MPRYTDEEVVRLLASAKFRSSDGLESETIEFKGYRDEQALHNAKDLAEEVSALANRNGGLIVVGVRSGGEVAHGNWADQLAGLPDVDIIETQVRIQGRLNPRIPISVRQLAFEGKHYVLITVPHRPDTLVATTSGKICIREGRSSRAMTPNEIELAVKGLTTYDWSAEPVEVDVSTALDQTALPDALADFCKRRNIASLDEERFLEAIGATRNGHLLKGGLLFLGTPDAIRQRLGDFEYRFSWKTSAGGLKVNDVWQGCVWQAVKRAKAHFDASNQTRTFTYRDKPFEAPLLDTVAFHEAYLNALVHRDYSSEGMISVNFTGDKIVISSPGQFYGGITAENIVLHEPRHRNKALARILMTFNLVDRAGMGVVRMGLRSLMYGRPFPEFREAPDAIEVVMDAEYLRPAVTVLALNNKDTYGLPELLILNSVFETGYVAVRTVEQKLQRLVDSPWEAIQKAVDKIAAVELCGVPAGIHIRVKKDWMSFMEVSRVFRVNANSDKHVKLFGYLKRHGNASNGDIRDHLGHAHSSQTSRFLREAKYVQRKGSGPSARWSLV